MRRRIGRGAPRARHREAGAASGTEPGLVRNRRSTPQPIADAPVMEWLKYDLAKVRQHAEDSRTLLWWYLLPFLIGMFASTWGMPVDLLTVKIPMTVLVALIAGVTYWLNQRVWRKQWVPMQQELEALLRVEEK